MTSQSDRPTWVSELKAAGQGAVVQMTVEDDAYKHGFQNAQQAGNQTQGNTAGKRKVFEVEVQAPEMENMNRIKTALHQLTQPYAQHAQHQLAQPHMRTYKRADYVSIVRDEKRYMRETSKCRQLCQVT